MKKTRINIAAIVRTIFFSSLNLFEKNSGSVIASFIRDIIIYKELEDKNILINVDKGKDISKLSSALSYKKLNSMLGYVEEARKNFISNVNYSMTMSVMLIGFMEG